MAEQTTLDGTPGPAPENIAPKVEQPKAAAGRRPRGKSIRERLRSSAPASSTPSSSGPKETPAQIRLRSERAWMLMFGTVNAAAARASGSEAMLLSEAEAKLCGEQMNIIMEALGPAAASKWIPVVAAAGTIANVELGHIQAMRAEVRERARPALAVVPSGLGPGGIPLADQMTPPPGRPFPMGPAGVSNGEPLRVTPEELARQWSTEEGATP